MVETVRIVKRNQQRAVKYAVQDDGYAAWLLDQLGITEISHGDLIALWDAANRSDLTVEHWIDEQLAKEAD